MKTRGLKKILFQLFLLVISVCGIHVNTAAAEKLEVFVEDSRVENDRLIIYANDNVDRSDTLLHAENFSVTLGDKTLPCTDLSYFAGSDEPMAYIYLVDVSGSISEERLQKMKDCLKAVTSGLHAQDKVCVISLGNDLHIGDFVSGQTAITTAIDEITGLSDDTNLYYGIVESLKLLDSAEHGCTKKALIILSDGQDDQATGITREEVNQYLEKTRIPVYTIAMLSPDASREKQEFAKILGSFARLSAGGIHTTYGLDDTTLDSCASQITSAVNDSFLLSVDFSGYTPSNGKAFLEVTLNLEGRGSASDGFEISEKEISDALAQQVTQTESEMQPQTKKAVEMQRETELQTEIQTELQTEIKQDSKTSGIPWWVWAIAAAAVAVLIVILIFRKNDKKPDERKPQPQPQPEPQPESETQQQPEPQPEPQNEPQMDSERENNTGHAVNEDIKTKSRMPDAVIYLTTIGTQRKITQKLELFGETTIGRKINESDYAFPDDKHISGVHCAIMYNDGDIVLWDKDSSNGTRVNGVPIKAPYVLKKDDIIQIGKTEFRVYW